MFHKIIKSKPFIRYRVKLALWKLAKLERWAAQKPFLQRLFRVTPDGTSENSDAIIVPINEVIQGRETIVLPYQILSPIVSKAAGHLLLNRCPCRSGEGCKTYPHEFGCLFLGEAVREVSNKIGLQTDPSGAMQHVTEALEMGLVPMIVHASFDADLISVPYHKMLAVCFCCNCCCTVRHHMRLGPSTFDDTVQRLPGLSVIINERCTGCGSCHAICPVQAISFERDVSVINQERCKGCGLCAAICSDEAPQLRLENSAETSDVLLERIRSRTQIGI